MNKNTEAEESTQHTQKTKQRDTNRDAKLKRSTTQDLRYKHRHEMSHKRYERYKDNTETQNEIYTTQVYTYTL